MTHRISDIDLKALREAFELNPRALFASEAAACMAELQQSRALISQLQAKAEHYGHFIALAEKQHSEDEAKVDSVISKHNELVAKLRELAERMRNCNHGLFQEGGKRIATSRWLHELDSLLSAHGAQGEKANKHICGLQGYNPMAGDPPCPGCEEMSR